MKTFGKVVIVTLACALLISGIAVMSPRAVHAVVATLIKDQDQAARHPFTTSCIHIAAVGNSISCSTPTIAGGQEVVIETVAIQASADPGNSVLRPSVATTASGVTQPYVLYALFDNGLFQPHSAEFDAAQPLRLYADPGTAISCFVETAASNPTIGLAFSCSISGYYVTLP